MAKRMAMVGLVRLLVLGHLAAAHIVRGGDTMENDEWLAENAAIPGWTTTASGLQYKVLRRGPAQKRRPTVNNYVVVSYSGWLPNRGGDSNIARGTPLHKRARVGTPAYAPHVLQEIFPDAVMRGLREGVLLMGEGDKYEFVIPPALAYGAGGGRGVPADAILLLTVDLHAVRAGRGFRVVLCALCLLPLAYYASTRPPGVAP